MDAKVPSRVGARRAYAQASTQTGGQIHYRYAGPDSGRSPLMLLHPFPSSSDVYETFMLEMGRDRTVIAPDLPGYGLSDAPDAPPSIADYASAMLAFEAKLGVGMLDVMGYHAGGSIAAEMARQQPTVVRKIVTIGALVFTPEEQANLRKGFVEAPPDKRADGFLQGWINFKTNFWRMGKDETRTWNLYIDAQRNPHTSHWGFRAAADYDLPRTLETLTQPMLVLDLGDDVRKFTARAGAHLKNGRVHALPGWTHGFLDAEAAETGRIVRSFLDN
jgi:pimeloyl-ACP methyl ester carboxylesterase